MIDATQAGMNKWVSKARAYYWEAHYGHLPRVWVAACGKNKWAWAATQASQEDQQAKRWNAVKRFLEEQPIDDLFAGLGYAASKEEAFARCQEALGTDDFVYLGGTLANWWHQDQVEKRKATRPPKAAPAPDLGYLYTCFRAYSDDGWIANTDHVHAWRITRVTENSVYIEDEACGEWTPDGLKVFDNYLQRPLGRREKRLSRTQIDDQGQADQKSRYSMQQETRFYSSAVTAWEKLSPDAREMPPEKVYWGYYAAGKMGT
jgi:hypothetical protein